MKKQPPVTFKKYKVKRNKTIDFQNIIKEKLIEGHLLRYNLIIDWSTLFFTPFCSESICGREKKPNSTCFEFFFYI